MRLDSGGACAQVLWNTTTVEAYGNEKGMLGGLKIQDVKTKEIRDLAVSGLFFAIGHEPASKFLNNQVCSLHSTALHNILVSVLQPRMLEQILVMRWNLQQSQLS